MAEIRTQIGINVKKEGQKTSSSKKTLQNLLDAQKKISKETKNATSEMNNFNKSLKNSAIVSWGAIIKKTTDFLISAGRKQADYVENLNLMQVAFGETSKEAENFVDTLNKEIGLDQSTITRQLGVFRQMSNAMGYTSEVSDLLSTNLSKLQLDMASLYNLDFKRAGNALESAMTGQVKTIRSLTGADITEATLAQKALAMGIDESVESMSRAEKAILIYLSLEDQLAEANGDLAKTINSTSNQIKIFNEQIQIASRQLGALFIPALDAILPILNGIMMAFNEVIAMFLTLIGADVSSLADEFGIAASGLNDIENGLTGVSKASKEAKKGLRGFDKLNNITTPSKSGGGSGGGSGANEIINSKLLDSLKEYNLHLDRMKNKATQIRDNIMQWLGFSKKVNGEWSWSGGTLLKNIWNWWSKLNGLAKIFVSLGAVAVVNGLYTAFKNLGTYLKRTKIGAMIDLISESIGRKGLAKTITEINEAYGGFAKFVEVVVGLTATVDGIIGIADGIESIAENGTSLEGVADIIWGVTEALSGLALVFGAISGNTTAIIGGIAGIAIALGGQFLTNLITAKSETQQLYDSLNSEIWNDLAIYNRTQELSRELENYIGVNGRVKKSDEDRVAFILNQMNSAFGTEYELIDGVIKRNGVLVSSYEDVESEIDEYMAKLKAQMILEKYQDAYITALEKKEEHQKRLNNENKIHTENLELINEEYDSLVEELGSVEAAEKAIADARKMETNRHNAELEKINKKYQEYNDLIIVYENLQKANHEGNLKDIQDLTTQIIGSQAQVSQEAAKEMEKNAKTASDKIEGYLRAAINAQKGYDLSRGMGDKIKEGLDKSKIGKGYDIHFRGVVDITEPKVNKNVEKKADGGFVDEGQMFIAREDGPEMVGTIGRHTAVANNDQIVDAISIGVTKAMMAMGNKSTTVNITAEGDASGLLDFITFKQKEKDRQFGLG